MTANNTAWKGQRSRHSLRIRFRYGFQFWAVVQQSSLSMVGLKFGFAKLLLVSAFSLGAKATVRGVNLGGWLVTEPWCVFRTRVFTHRCRRDRTKEYLRMHSTSAGSCLAVLWRQSLRLSSCVDPRDHARREPGDLLTLCPDLDCTHYLEQEQIGGIVCRTNERQDDTDAVQFHWYRR